MSAKNEIKFEPMPGPHGGLTHLGIYTPDPACIFTRDGTYAAFVGGCGWGHSKTLAGAKRLLLDSARIYCQRQIDKAETVIAHYRVQLAKLEQGLPPQVKGA